MPPQKGFSLLMLRVFWLGLASCSTCGAHKPCWTPKEMNILYIPHSEPWTIISFSSSPASTASTASPASPASKTAIQIAINAPASSSKLFQAFAIPSFRSIVHRILLTLSLEQPHHVVE